MDDDDDEDDDGDDVLPLLAVRRIPFLSWPILPPDGLQRLGFCLLDEFLESLFVPSPICFDWVKVVDPPEAAAHQTTTHTGARGHMEHRRLLWKRNAAVSLTFMLDFLWKVFITFNA